MATIVPVQSPSSINTSSTPQENSQQSAKARAIAALMGTQSTPVQNQNSISAEEAGALTQNQPTKDSHSTVEGTTTSEATPPTPSKEVPLSTQYAALARKEKALRSAQIAQDRQYQQRENALKAREQELTNKPSFDPTKYISIDDLKQDAYGNLTRIGVAYDDISQQAIAAQSPEAQSFQRYKTQMEGELQKVRDEQAKIRQSSEQQQAQAYQQAVQQIRTEANQLVTADPNYETIKATNSVSDVVELIERTFKEEGTLLTVEQAAQAVEDYLVDEALKLANIKKIQARMKPAAPSSAAPATTQAQPVQMKTLTNAVGSSRPLTAKERALLAFKGELHDNKKS